MEERKMKTSLTKRLLAMLLVLCLVIPMAPTFTLPARAAETDPVIVVAGSDFQANTHELSAANVTALLNSVKTNGGYGSIDGFLFAGDYTNAWTVAEATNGLSALKGAVNAVYPGAADSKNAIYIQGNHDSTPMVGDSLADTGAHDADAYGVYVINEDDLAWHNDGSAAKAEATWRPRSESATISRSLWCPIFRCTTPCVPNCTVTDNMPIMCSMY